MTDKEELGEGAGSSAPQGDPLTPILTGRKLSKNYNLHTSIESTYILEFKKYQCIFNFPFKKNKSNKHASNVETVNFEGLSKVKIYENIKCLTL